MSSSRYATVVLDVDSTVSGIEGIDWLASRRGPEVAAKIVELTNAAMEGRLPLEDVYGERLRLVAPTSADIETLAEAYVASIAPGCVEAVARLREADVRVVIVSGGLREAVLPLADAIGIDRDDVHAVSVRFLDDGSYAGFDAASPLTVSGGKRTLVQRLALPGPVLAVGDGATDLDMKGAVATFGAFTGFVRREAVIRAADAEFRSFAEVAEWNWTRS